MRSYLVFFIFSTLCACTGFENTLVSELETSKKLIEEDLNLSRNAVSRLTGFMIMSDERMEMVWKGLSKKCFGLDTVDGDRVFVCIKGKSFFVISRYKPNDENEDNNVEVFRKLPKIKIEVKRLELHDEIVKTILGNRKKSVLSERLLDSFKLREFFEL